MNRRFGFADSEVAAVVRQGGALLVRFSAAQVSEADPGSFTGWADGHVAGVVLACHGVTHLPPSAVAPGRLAEGRAGRHGAWLARLPLPFDAPGPWRIELRFARGDNLTFDAARLQLLPGDGPFVASLAC